MNLKEDVEPPLLIVILLMLLIMWFIPSPKKQIKANKVDFGYLLLYEEKEKEFPQGDKTPSQPPVVDQPVVETLQRNAAIYQGGCEQWRALVAKYFPPEQIDNALAIINAESGGNPYAVSPTDDHGLFQINRGTWYGYAENLPLEMAYDPETNVRIASYIFNTRGWQPWTTARKLGLY